MKRYNPNEHRSYFEGMGENPQGEWARFDDVQALAKEMLPYIQAAADESGWPAIALLDKLRAIVETQV